MPDATQVRALAGAALFALLPFLAHAQEEPRDLPIIGMPTNGAMGWQPAATELARDLHWLDGLLLVIISGVSLLVLALILIVILRYNSRRNPTPAKFTHNSPVEVAWTLGPVFILVFIGAFSLPVLFKQQVIPEADVTIKATGYQWYWNYEYPDSEFSFDSYMIGSPATGGDNRLTPEVEAQLQEAGYSREHFLLATDTAMVVPVGQTIVVQVTASDVIHSWTVPAFGVKQDGVPGRLAELWFTVDEPGIYFGQCSELCGIAHAYMPITVKVVSEERYAEWIENSGGQLAGFVPEVDVAQADREAE